MTNQQKGFLLVGLFVAWGGMTVYQMSDFSDSSSSDLSSTLQQANSTLPTVKALSLDQSFPNSRQMVTFSQPRNIFAPLGLPKVIAKPKPRSLQLFLALPSHLLLLYRLAPLLQTWPNSEHGSSSTNFNFWGI